MSRAKELSCLAIRNESANLFIQNIQKIGATKPYNLRSKLNKRALITQEKVIKAIKK